MSITKWIWPVLAVVGALLCGAAWSLSSPVGSSPDDNYHLPSIWCVGADRSPDPECQVVDGVSELTGGHMVLVPALVAASSNCYATKPAVTGKCQDEINASPPIPTGAVDEGDYPGGYYWAMHQLVGDSVVTSVLLIRAVNVGIAVLLFALIGFAAAPAVRRSLIYALTATMIPLGWFITASVNPSSWAITGVTGTGFALLGLMSVQDRWRKIMLVVLALVSALVAVNARGDAAVYIGAVAAAVSIRHWRTLLERPKLLVAPLAVMAIGAYNVLTSAQVASVAGREAETDRPASVVLSSLFLDGLDLASGMFGYRFGLGWLDTAVYPVTAFTMCLVVGFFVLSGFARWSWSKALSIGVLLTLLVAFPLYTMYVARLVIGESVQPRYLLPLVPITLGLLLTLRRPERSFRLATGQAVAIWLATTAACTAALYANTRRYVAGVDSPMLIEKVTWWWPWAPSPYVVVAFGGLGFALFSSLLIWTAVRPRRRDAERSAVPAGASA